MRRIAGTDKIGLAHQRVGRRTLLVSSLLLISLSTAVLGWSINTDRFTVASVGIIAFVVSFSLGLGPVPFVLVGEMSQPEVRYLVAEEALDSGDVPRAQR